jgi:thiamine-monophosphate kinase
MDRPRGAPFAVSETSEQTVSQVGEFGLIRRFQEIFRTGGVGVVRGIGDDTATLRVSPGSLLLATTDTALEGVHFLRSTTTPHLLGQRILAVNLSDVAAMGGTPRWALISLSLPEATSLRFAEELATGLAEAAQRYATTIVGGNVARSPDRIVVDVTLLGEARPDRVLYRSGARPGDRLLVTGTLGDSAAGLAILLGQAPGDVPGADYLIARHRLPTPRVEAGLAISATGRATAMLDLSDGLASDIGHLAEASQVGAVIWADRLPLSAECAALTRIVGRNPLDWAMRGGEDYELLLAAPPHAVEELTEAVRRVGVELTDVGEIVAGRQVVLVTPDGRRQPPGAPLWQHF